MQFYTPEEELLLSAKTGNLPRLIDLLNQGANPRYVDEYGNTALLWAVSNGHIPLVRHLLNTDASSLTEKNAIDNDTALHIAATNGQLQMVQFLMNRAEYGSESKNNDIFTLRNNENHSPLELAVIHGKEDVLDFLLAHHNCNIQKENDERFKQLFLLAVKNNQINIVNYFLCHKTHTLKNKRNLIGSTLLGVVKQVEMIFLLLKAVSSKERIGFLKPIFAKMIASNKIQDVKQFLSLVDAQDLAAMTKERNFIFDAISSDNVEMFEYILNNVSCDIMEEYDLRSGNRVLHYAAWNGCSNMIKYLVNNKRFNIYDRNADGETPLLLAAAFGHILVVECLIKECGASINQTNHKGDTVLLQAVRFRQMEVIEFLVKQHQKALLATNFSGEDVLNLVMEKEDDDFIIDLLKLGVYLDVSRRNVDYGPTPRLVLRAEYLMALTENDDKKIDEGEAFSEILSDLKSGLNARRIKDGNTALHLALLNKRDNIAMRLLKSAGINIDIENNQGVTPFDIAQKGDPRLFALCCVLRINACQAELKILREKIEVAESKGIKEIKELQETIDTLQSRLQKTLDQGLRTLERMVQGPEKETLQYVIGMYLGDPMHPLDPATAYALLREIKKERNPEEFSKATACMFQLLMSRRVRLMPSQAFDDEQPTPVNLYPSDPEEGETCRVLRLRDAIKHCLNSDNDHVPITKLMAEYALGDEFSMQGLGDYKGKDTEVILILLDKLRTETLARKVLEKKLAAAKAEILRLQQFVRQQGHVSNTAVLFSTPEVSQNQPTKLPDPAIR